MTLYYYHIYYRLPYRFMFDTTKLLLDPCPDPKQQPCRFIIMTAPMPICISPAKLSPQSETSLPNNSHLSAKDRVASGTLAYQTQAAVDAGIILKNDLLKVELQQNDFKATMIDLDNGIALCSNLLGQYIIQESM